MTRPYLRAAVSRLARRAATATATATATGCALGLALLSAGCSSVAPNTELTKSWFRPEATYEVPEQMMVVWTDAVQSIPGQPPRRGCGGRLYFFDKKSRPIPVNGTLVVYAFDDAAASDGTQPQARYVFSPQQFTRSFAESELGASYNIWVPWDELGNPQKKLTLMTVYRDASGKIIKADPAFVVLPGKVELTERQKRGFYEPDPVPGSRRGVAPVSYDSGDSRQPKRKLKTTTIHVPRAFSERMAALPPAESLDLVTRRERYKNAQPWSVDLSQPPTRPTVAPPSSSLGYRGYTAGSPSHTASARATAWSRHDPRSARFERTRSPVPTSLNAQPIPSGGRSPQSPPVPQWNLPSGAGLRRPVPAVPAAASDRSDSALGNAAFARGQYWPGPAVGE